MMFPNYCIRRIFLLLCIVFCCASLSMANEYAGPPFFKKDRYKIPKYSKGVMLDRLETINPAIDPVMNSTVKKCINSFVSRGRKGSETVLGKSFIYFPIFDHYLKQYDLPADLKAIAIVESMLNPKAKSPVGAVGLWQFMPKTGRYYGLKIDSYVDERMDPHKSTEAAVRYLSDLYDMFGDWALAAAAYNCGPGNLRKAIRKGKSKDFWKIRRHLPKETQMYVPKIIGATYLINYYLFHDLHPSFPDYNLQHTEEVVVYGYLNFKQIADQTGIPLEIIKRLNPCYKKGIIPPNEAGNFIILPQLGLEGALVLD